jgi:hypothetical protein
MTADYRKSSFSTWTCVEVASLPGETVSVRNSRDTTGPALSFTRDEWAAFVAGVKTGEFDLGLDIDALLAQAR